MKIWKSILLSLVVLQMSCSQQVASIKPSTQNKLTDNHGYLLLSVDTSIDLEQLNVSGQKSFHLGAADLTAGTHHILVDLPAGDYQIDSVKLNNWWRLQLKSGYWNFKVQAGQISYIGDLQLKGRLPELENRSSMALQYLEQQHKALLKNYQVRYSGPGDDHYFEFATAQGVTP